MNLREKTNDPSEVLKYFSEAARDPGQWLIKWKAQNGKPIFGCAPMFVCEELIHSYGILPVVLWEGSEPITLGHTRIQPFFCGIVRGMVDQLLRGKLSYIDGFIAPDICIPLRSLPDVVRYNSSIPFNFLLYLPKDCSKNYSRTFLIKELLRLSSGLSKFTQQEFSENRLRESIILYNRHRALMRRLYQLRRSKPGIISARQMMEVVASAMILPKEEHSLLLETLITNLEAGPYNVPKGPRLVLSGALCSCPPSDLLELIEALGGVVVDDDLYCGARYFPNDVGGDHTIEDLADAYKDMSIPNPVALDSTNRWGDYIIETAKQSGAQGIITLVTKYCEPHLLVYPDVASKLSENAIPNLMLEIEHETASRGQQKTRIQAFLETIERKAQWQRV